MSSPGDILFMHLAGGVITLYMLLVIVRWFGPYLELELKGVARRAVALADPPIELARRLVGQTAGPFDWAPVFVLLALWLVRLLLIQQ